MEAPLNRPAYWTQARLELRAWLQRNAPSLAELYEGALLLVVDVPLPGRVRFVGHAVREIRNRLPDVIAGERKGGTLQYKNRLDVIAKIWVNSGFTENDDTSGVTQTPDVKISIVLFREVDDLVRDHELTRSKPMDEAVRLFEASAPENKAMGDSLRPIVAQWLDVTEWFMKRAHDSGKVDGDCNEEELRSRFEVFELSLGALARGFFGPIEDLDEILEDTNS